MASIDTGQLDIMRAARPKAGVDDPRNHGHIAQLNTRLAIVRVGHHCDESDLADIAESLGDHIRLS